jgi:hypothetical protein
MYDVREYTFGSHKVAQDISAPVKATVVPVASGNDLLVPEHTVIFLTTGSADAAFFVAAILNSEPVGKVISGYIVDNHLSTHPIENAVIPQVRP